MLVLDMFFFYMIINVREYMLLVNIGMYKFFGIIKGKFNNYEDI